MSWYNSRSKRSKRSKCTEQSVLTNPVSLSQLKAKKMNTPSRMVTAGNTALTYQPSRLRSGGYRALVARFDVGLLRDEQAATEVWDCIIRLKATYQEIILEPIDNLPPHKSVEMLRQMGFVLCTAGWVWLKINRGWRGPAALKRRWEESA